jgi:hypothetical protein
VNRATFGAAVLIASSAFLAPAQAQNAYRCGNTYSQTPCPGGMPVDASDKRTSEQKAQADEVARRELRMADALEKSRLQQEEEQRKAAVKSAEKPAKKAATKEKTSTQHIHVVKKKAKAAENGTAKTSGSTNKSGDSAMPPRMTPAAAHVAK